MTELELEYWRAVLILDLLAAELLTYWDFARPLLYGILKENLWLWKSWNRK